MYNTTVARLTYRGLLGRRRALLLFGLPGLLLVVAGAVRLLAGRDEATAVGMLGGFALATVVPLVGVIVGTGATGPEIDDGSIVYLLAKPLSRPGIVLTKLAVAAGTTIAFAAVPTYLAGLLLAGNGGRIAVAFGAAAAVASVAYAALFLFLGIVTRHAVVVGLVYALVWEGVVGSFIPGAKALSVQQWALALAQETAAAGTVTSEVGLPLASALLAVLTATATWFAVQRLRSLTLAGEA
ncbi:ABC transporter permease subunit [Streptomyces sp. NPDC059506]|uniref:ABC transporter permease subunit n=1 Tax=Streptomyces TaxID=1883 RepID=UPI000CB7031E|nr:MULTISPECIES: ABC transporter permease subunit [unclassified Streptomyces]MCZ2525097.1 ABC transporter permease [Streptomyces sp. HB2AG]PLW66501.1 hypothetical protein C0036_22430 [Streptomyces sp. DJ]QMV25066.1 ABC transporter permease [Streptomyces sp. SCUT-3]